MTAERFVCELLVAAVPVFGGRVTSFVRTVAENEKVGGHPASKHLVGEAVDVAADAPGPVRRLMAALGTAAMHDKGTGPHYHFVPDPVRALNLLVGLLAVVVLMWHPGRR